MMISLLWDFQKLRIGIIERRRSRLGDSGVSKFVVQTLESSRIMENQWNHGESSRFIDADRGSMTKHKVQIWFVGLSSLVWMLFGTREDPGQERVVESTSRARFMLHHR